MLAIFGLVIMTKESVIESEAQRDRGERERDREQRQDAKLARGELPRIQRHKKESKRTAHGAAHAKAERVLEGLLYRVVNRIKLLRLSRYRLPNTRDATKSS